MTTTTKETRLLALAVTLLMVVAACGNGDETVETTTAPDDITTTAPETTEPDEVEETTPPEEPTVVRAGWVSAVDQLGLPAALEQGFFEAHGLDVQLADPFPTGVDMLNAVEAGEIDIAQVGVPAIGAILQGMDLILVGNYTGSATQLGIDETMAMVAREGSDIDPNDLSTLAGKSFGVSVGSINHLYLLGVLEELGIDPVDVEIINTPPPEMSVALETAGLDAAVIWDPWPVVATTQVDGAYEVMRGGGFIAFIGYMTGLREYMTQNADTVVRFLAARAEADRWLRDNPDQAAELATRWLPGTELEVAQQAMQYNVRQLDPRISACNFLALHVDQGLLLDVGTIEGTFPVDERIDPTYILQVVDSYPEFFDDLTPVPDAAAVEPGYSFDEQQARQACDD